MLTKNERDFLSKIPKDRKVTIQPFDSNTTKVGESLVSEIKRVLPKSIVLFMGATALGIAGQNDIDIYILSDRNKFPKYLTTLQKLFGKPKHIHKTFIEWKFKEKSYSAELYLTEPPERQIRVFDILKADKNLLKGYEDLKLKFDGKSFREYQRAKYEFYNRLLNNSV